MDGGFHDDGGLVMMLVMLVMMIKMKMTLMTMRAVSYTNLTLPTKA